MNSLKIIAFDADDTLWVNEPFFRETEQQFYSFLEDYLSVHSLQQELYKTEMANLSIYGYGVKSFILSMIETAQRVTESTASPELINKVIELGKGMLKKPVELLGGVKKVLEQLSGRYRLVLATKGDLLDQERKLVKSGLEKHFHHIEVMSHKEKADYRKLRSHLDCQPEEFLMIGNSLKSDIIPVLEIGSYAAHVPFHITWHHEVVDIKIDNDKFFELKNISEVLKILN